MSIIDTLKSLIGIKTEEVSNINVPTSTEVSSEPVTLATPVSTPVDMSIETPIVESATEAIATENI